jgi:hypothetical protein
MYNSKSGSCRKLRPIDSLPKPFEVVSEELVICGALVHECIAESNSCMEDGVTTFKAIPDLVQYAQVGMIVSIQEFEV